MAISAKVLRDGYSYIDTVDYLDDEVINKSKQQYEAMRSKGIIIADAYDAMCWRINDEVTQATLNFAIDQLHYIRESEKRLGCTYQQYQTAMRVLITSAYGASIYALQIMCRAYRYFANHLAVKTQASSCKNELIILDLLSVLPGDTEFKARCIDECEDAIAANEFNRSPKQQRTLCTYQSYFRFEYYLDKFWVTAAEDEKILFFPIYLWWKLTSILPLRPTEFVLTPRHCLVKKDDAAFLIIRRTKLKGTRFSAEYFIEKDYRKEEFQVPTAMADIIAQYQKSTEASYISDMDTLFSKTDQFLRLNVVSPNDHHYSYMNLHQCLNHYYKMILQNKFGLEVIDKGLSTLGANEIEFISLGDTRHISMVSLIVSGGNPVICKELAGHDSIEMSSKYYSNIKNFLDVLSFDRYRPPDFQVTSNPAELGLSGLTAVNEGHCESPNVKNKDYQDCISAVDNNGHMMACRSCRYFLPRGHGVKLATSAEKDLKQSFVLLRYAINHVRSGMGFQESIDSALSKFQANALQYTNAITKRYLEVNTP